MFATSILSHFGTGLRPEIAKVVLSTATPPETPPAMLAAAETVEAELSKKASPGLSALAVQMNQGQDPPTEEPVDNLAEKLEELVPAVGHFQPRRTTHGSKGADDRSTGCFPIPHGAVTNGNGDTTTNSRCTNFYTF